MPQSLSHLFRPRSVAVVGASRQKGSIGYEVFRNLLRGDFTGAVYPVTPHSAVVQAVRAWPTVSSIPDPIDLAVLTVPADQVLDVVEDCGKKGVKGLVIISGGFAETGPTGALLQRRLVERTRALGMRVIGPNCLGLMNAHPAVQLNATFAPSSLHFGGVAFASQSGALGLAVLDEAEQLGLGISQFVSLGNKADVSGNDLLELWEDDPSTRVVLFYMESLGNPRRFMDVARRVSRKKPIVVVKSGRTAAGHRAASSHTGARRSLEVATDALLGQSGIIRTDTIHELFDVATLLAHQPVPAGNRVAIVTNAGGPGIMAADACESRGLEVAPLEDQTQRALEELLPEAAAVSNPVDLTGNASAGLYAKALRQVLDDPTVDSALVLFVTPIVTDPKAVAEAILAASERKKKPLLTCVMGRHGVQEAIALLRAHHIPVFDFPEAAAGALAKAVGYGNFLAGPEGQLVELERFDLPRVQALVKAGLGHRQSHWLPPAEVSALLEAAGLTCVKGMEAPTAEEAVEAAQQLGFPVVVKVLSDTIVHKREVGGVVLGVESTEGVKNAFATVVDHLITLDRKNEMRGVLVQRQITGGVETYVACSRDPKYGPLVGFGIGGVGVEVWRDVAFRLAPLRDTDAQGLLTSIRGRSLLEGPRVGGPIDRTALEDALLRVGRLMSACPEISELDLNPIIAKSKGALVTDARIRLERRPEPLHG